MSKVSLEDLEKIIAGATDGPWSIDGRRIIGPKGNTLADMAYKNQAFDQPLVTAARSALPALLARYREMKLCIKQYKELHTQWNGKEGVFEPDEFGEAAFDELEKCAEFEKDVLK